MAKRVDFGLGLELDLVEKELNCRTQSDVVLITQMCFLVVGSGGLRLSPAFLLLSFKASGGDDASPIIKLAAAVELIHTATLIHDDINDEGILRRGREAASCKYGRVNALIAGDYLFALGFGMAGAYGREIIELTSATSRKLAESEIRQARNIGNLEFKVNEYMELIEGKTACLFSAGARMGSMLAGAPTEIQGSLADFGLQLGLAFQITDDVLDITGDELTLGKLPGADIAQGNVTLPLILGVKLTKGKDRSDLVQMITTVGNVGNNGNSLKHARDILTRVGALEAAMQSARHHREKALEALSRFPASDPRDRLEEYADHIISRCN